MEKANGSARQWTWTKSSSVPLWEIAITLLCASSNQHLHYRPFWRVWQLLSQSVNQGMKRHVVGNRLYAVDWVSMSFQDASELLCLRLYQKFLLKGATTKLYWFLHEPDCWHQWMLATRRCEWAPTEHTCICSSHSVKELSSHNHTGSSGIRRIWWSLQQVKLV